MFIYEYIFLLIYGILDISLKPSLTNSREDETQSQTSRDQVLPLSQDLVSK